MEAMMRIQIASDLHFDHTMDFGSAMLSAFEETAKEVDVLVLAGDVIPLVRHPHTDRIFKRLTSAYPQVVFVPGNHDYYGTSPEATHEKISKLESLYSNLHVLNRGNVVINNQRFFGASLWFPQEENSRLRRNLNDFSQISRFTPWVYEQHKRDLDFIRNHARADDIVITHHLPHSRSIDPRFKYSDLNCFFHAADCDAVLKAVRPGLWIHGHTHSTCDYQIDKTRVIANPCGYPGERGSNFNPALIIEVGEAT